MVNEKKYSPFTLPLFPFDCTDHFSSDVVNRFSVRLSLMFGSGGWTFFLSPNTTNRVAEVGASGWNFCVPPLNLLRGLNFDQIALHLFHGSAHTCTKKNKTAKSVPASGLWIVKPCGTGPTECDDWSVSNESLFRICWLNMHTCAEGGKVGEIANRSRNDRFYGTAAAFRTNLCDLCWLVFGKWCWILHLNFVFSEIFRCSMFDSRSEVLLFY